MRVPPLLKEDAVPGQAAGAPPHTRSRGWAQGSGPGGGGAALGPPAEAVRLRGGRPRPARVGLGAGARPAARRRDTPTPPPPGIPVNVRGGGRRWWWGMFLAGEGSPSAWLPSGVSAGQRRWATGSIPAPSFAARGPQFPARPVQSRRPRTLRPTCSSTGGFLGSLRRGWEETPPVGEGSGRRTSLCLS